MDQDEKTAVIFRQLQELNNKPEDMVLRAQISTMLNQCKKDNIKVDSLEAQFRNILNCQP